jgi:hypothetical protein
MRRASVFGLLALFILLGCAPAPAPTIAPTATSTGAIELHPNTPTAVPSDTPAPLTPGVANLSQSSVSDLVTLITSEKISLAEAFEATQEILARGGIAVGDMQNTFVRPYSPASSLVFTPREVLQLAEEARSGPSVWRMDLGEFGQMLGDLGWPSAPDGKTPGEQLAALLFAWNAEAAKNPHDPENFTPLFLLAMAQHRVPNVDFSTGIVAPENIRLSLLEVALFVAAFDHLIPPQKTSALSILHLASLLPAAQISPCKPFQDSLFGRLAYEGVGGSLLQWVAGKALEKGLEAAGISEWGQDKIGKAMFAVGMFSRVMRALLITAYVRIGVSIEGDNPVHKPPEGEQRRKTFHAQAGIPPQDWQTYQEQFGKSFHDALRECLSWLGVSTYTLDDLMNEMDTWAVEWRLEAGSPEHARWSPDQQIVPGQVHQGYWRTNLIRSGTGDVVGKSTFVVEVRNEKEKDHPGVLLEAPVKACAYLDVAQPPTFNTFFQAGAGGLAGAADSVVELLTGMMQKLAKPKDCQDLQVTYHTDCITALWYIQQGALKLDQKAMEQLRKCLTFELKFESQVEFVGITDKGSVRYRGVRETAVKLQLDPADFTIKGQAPLNPTATLELTTTGGTCATHLTTVKPGTFRVFNLEFVFSRRIQTDEVIVQDLKLDYDPGPDPVHEPRETFTVSCPKTPTFPMDTQAFWATGYMFGHSDEISSEGRVAKGWNILSGEEYAKKEWKWNMTAGASLSESGRFILYHRPEE